MTSRGELFSSGDLADDQYVEQTLDREAQVFTQAMAPEPDDYITSRRKLLGPEADITHPDFGLRSNNPEEKFSVFYRIKSTDTDMRGKADDQTLDISEYVLDHKHNIVDL